MAQEQKATSLDNFKFDDEDWSFGGQSKDNTDTSTVVNKVKAGTTIDDDDNDDDEGQVTNLEEEATKGEDDGEEEEEITTVKPAKKVENPAKEVKKEDKKKEVKKNKEEEEEEEEEEVTFDTFTDKPNSKKDGKSDEGEIKSKEKESVIAEDDEDFYTNLATELKEKGIFDNIEIPKDKKLTEEEFFELQDAEIEARVGETMEAFVEDLDDDAKAFIKHKKKGGSTRDFIETYYGSGIDYDNFDSDDEEQVDSLNRFYVSTVEGLKGDDLEDRLQGLKDSGKAKTKSIEWAAKLQKIEAKNKEELAAKVNEANQTKIDNAKKFNAALIDTLDKVSTVGNFTISKEDKKKLATFMTKPTVKVGKDHYVPALQVKLASILNPKNKESREKLIVLAKLVENDFDISDIIPKVETAIVRKANKLLQRSKRSISPSGGGESHAKRVLADMFEDDDN